MSRAAVPSRTVRPQRSKPKPSPRRWWPRLLLVAAAVALALLPMSAAGIDRVYSRGIYILLQPIVTSISSVVPFALLDAWVAGAALWVCVRLFRVVRAAPHRGRSAVVLLADAVVLAAALYVVFLGLWGLNYRRLPITAGVDFSAARVTPRAVEAFAHRAADEVNGLYESAHADASATDTLAAVRVRLAPAFAAAQRDLGATRLATGGRPKSSALALLFRWASVDGMVNPFGLDVILNPDVLPVERPFVLAHEWGHLAGWARESEASYVGWLTCLDGEASARYSGWLSVYMTLRGAIPRASLSALDASLADGPRRDLDAIAHRLAAAQPLVRAVSWHTYDRFLKANRVPSGLASYDEVVTLLVGTAVDSAGKPRTR